MLVGWLLLISAGVGSLYALEQRAMEWEWPRGLGSLGEVGVR